MAKPKVHPETLALAVEEFTNQLLDEEIFYGGMDIGRRLRWGELEALGVLTDVTPEYQIVDLPGHDIFGQPLTKKYAYECECPNCHRPLASARFAPHLEKCVGMGRNSSRVASRRLAAASGNSNAAPVEAEKSSTQTPSSSAQATAEAASEDEHYEDIEDDEEWTMEKKKKSKKSEKAAPKKKGGQQKGKSGDSSGQSQGSLNF